MLNHVKMKKPVSMDNVNVHRDGLENTAKLNKVMCIGVGVGCVVGWG